MRTWIVTVATFVVSFCLLRAIAVLIAGEGSLLVSIAQGVAVFGGILLSGTLVRRRRSQNREDANEGAEADWNAAGYKYSTLTFLIGSAIAALGLTLTQNLVAVLVVAALAVLGLISFWAGRRSAR